MAKNNKVLAYNRFTQIILLSVVKQFSSDITPLFAGHGLMSGANIQPCL